jgi:hypothetical protein
MELFNVTIPRLTDTKKFYFLEYFYILLKSVEKFNEPQEVFSSFKEYKENLFLGESRYKKIATSSEELTNKQIGRYKYTFNEVLEESKIYELVISDKEGNLKIGKNGKELLKFYDLNGHDAFYSNLFKLIETKTNGFQYFIKSLYELNQNKSGMIILPIYSPLKLNIKKNDITKTGDIIDYLEKLLTKIKVEISIHLPLIKDVNLENANKKLIDRLKDLKLIGDENSSRIEMKHYNGIIKRIRDYWLNFFLNDIYKLKVSLSYFDIWIFRAKQFGLINSTEFYPNYNGKIVYPVSIISNSSNSHDFQLFHTYINGEKLFLHKPNWDSFQDTFIMEIYKSYFDLKKSNRSYFINLLDLSEIVCYKLKISFKTFVEFLESAYQLNLKNRLQIKISLEADRLPFETNAMYLKRDPIIIDNKLRNIIAIDLTKNEKDT